LSFSPIIIRYRTSYQLPNWMQLAFVGLEKKPISTLTYVIALERWIPTQILSPDYLKTCGVNT
jgi:hypothetical protein